MKCLIRKTFSWLLLLGALVLSLSLMVGMLTANSAAAAIRQQEERPGHLVYQSRQTLKDTQGNSWIAIAFKRIRPDGKTSFSLRLVGFPGMVEIDRAQPLSVTNSLGKMLTAADDSSAIFTDSAAPEPHVGQYDLQPLLSQLQPEIPLKLTLPTIDGQAINLSVPPSFVQEWKTLASL